MTLPRSCVATLPSIPSRYRTLPSATFYSPRQLHTSSSRLAAEQDHYAILEVSPSASPSDIKKSFYALSKRHHPDRNPNNHEEAERKFIEVGDAYAILSNTEKRARYDRERTPAAARGVASYGSSSPGGRPASGLSRRRSAFHGPPPSFYRSGGWGSAQTQSKRARAADADGRMEWERLRKEEEVRAQGGKTGEDDGSGWPFTTDPNDVPHFNRARHYRRTSTVEEQLRQGRKKRRKVFTEDFMSDGGGSEMRAFFLVSTVVAVGVGAPLIFLAR